MPDPTLKSPTMAELDALDSINGDQLLKEISEFIGRYLQCSEQQRTVLALWVLHTYCLPAAQVTPYLAIRSAEKQSGKSLCLRLLSLLCDHPALTASFTANTLSRRIDGPISTVLLDECQATLGTRNRSKSPALRAVLAGGFECGPGYTDATHERNIFAPKAFAGMGQLPESLADRSISIILRPLKKSNKNAACNTVTSGQNARVAQSPGSPAPGSPTHADVARDGVVVRAGVARDGVEVPSAVSRFNLRRAEAEAKPLQERIYFWTEGNLHDLEERPSYSREDFPPNLAPRQQDMVEPLLQLADFIGGEWPARIREALADLFLREAAFELAQSLQLLADVRDCFAWHNFPDRLSTATLINWMHTRPARPWDVDGPITARNFARLLIPFEIYPRLQRIGKDDPARGYQLSAFAEHWKTHFGFEVPTAPTPAETAPGRDPGLSLISPTAKSQEPKAIFPNNGAGCNAVADSGAVSVSTAESKPTNRKSNGHIENPTKPADSREQQSEEVSAVFIPPAAVSSVETTALAG